MSNWEKTEGQKGLDQADSTDQYFWTDTDGAHISSSGDHDTSGFHQLLTSVKNAFMHGTTELATFSEDLIELGKNSTSATINLCKYSISICGNVSTEYGNSAMVATNQGGRLFVGTNRSNGTEDNTWCGIYTSVDSSGNPNATIRAMRYTGNSNSSYDKTVSVTEDGVLIDGNPAYGAKILYDNPSGTNATITLSESAANFKYMEIYYAKLDGDSGGFCCQKVHNPNGKRVSFNQMNYIANAGVVQLVLSKVVIHGTVIGWEVAGTTVNFTAGSGALMTPGEAQQLIYRVVGYK